MMFDGALVASTADAIAPAPAEPVSPAIDSSTEQAPAAAPLIDGQQRQEVVFVDSKVTDHQSLAASLPAGSEIILLDGEQDGLQQIADYLEGRSGVDAVHILSHGQDGLIRLGTSILDGGNLAQHESNLQRIGSALDSGGDLLLYGCEVAASQAGRDLIQQIATLTQADVAASTDDTGAGAMGGNWTLEYWVGAIESASSLDQDALASYDGLLALPSSTQSLGDIYWNNNTGGNTVDGFSLTESTGATRASSSNSIYFSTAVVKDAPDNTGNYYYELTWTADGVDLGKFDLDGMVIQSFGGNYRLDFSATSGGVPVSQSFTYDGAQGPLTVDLNTALFNDISAFTVRVTNLSGSNSVANIDLQQVILADLQGSNTAPTAGNLNGDAVSFTEGGSAVLLDAGSNATVADSDSVNFDGGTVIASISGNRVSGEDVLSIRNQGTGAGQIGVSGANVTYGGTVIGSYTGGTGSNDLVVTLNANATPAAAQALVRNLTYSNSNTSDPSTSTRTVSVTVNDGDGGTSTAASISVSVTGVNDAPTLSAIGGTPTFLEGGAAVDLFSGVSIGTVEPGQTITGLTLTVSGLANGGAEFLAIDGTHISLTNGLSTTTATNGMTVTVGVAGGTATITLSKAGGISTASAQALVESIRYGNISDAPTENNRVVTLTSLTDNGGSANSGANTASVSLAATVSVVAVNDAPELWGGPAYALPTIDEDTTSGATLVSTILGGVAHGDPDNGAATGIAITASAGNGTWQYSIDGVTWNSVGTVSGNAALLLASTSQLRYVPDGANGETAALTFRAWDQSSGSATTNSIRNTADATTNGGTTAFSSGTAQASLTVTSVNDAPVLTATAPTLTGLADSDINNGGQTVASIVGTSTDDVDTGAVEGVAIIEFDSGSGTWQYSLDGGTSWTEVGTVSASSALLLRATDQIRFVPDGVSGTTASFTYRAWDQTSGTQGSKVDTSSVGGSTAFSTSSDTGSITVTAVDDPATVATSGGSTGFTEANGGTSTPVVIDSGLTLSDSDSATLSSASVSISGGFLSSEDLLAFSNNGSTMGNISASYDAASGVLTLTSAGATATVAQWQTALRSVTYSNSSDAPDTSTRTVSFVVNDGTTDSSAATKDVSIAAVNDAPTITVPATISVTEDAASALSGIIFSDVDAGGASVTATFSVATGSLSGTSGGGVTVGGTSSALTLSGTVANINAFIAGSNLTFTPASNANADITLSVQINDGGHTGAGGTQTASENTTLQVSAVNNAPVVTTPVSIAVTEDISTALTGISFADVDAGSSPVSATFSVASGTLSATSASGVTVTGSGTGSLALSGSIADINSFIAASGLSFQTAPNSTSNVVLTVDIADNGNSGTGGNLTDTDTVTLTVTAVNDAPVNTVPGAQSVDQDATLVFSSGNGNLISISDVDAGGGTVRVTLTGSNGLMTLSGTTGLSFIIGSGANDGSMTIEGTIADINSALNGLIFSPTPGYNGAASLQIVTNDLGLSGSGGNQTDTDSIAITVNSLNPEVTSVNVTNPDGGYKVGDVITVTLSFDQAVTVNTAGGSPTLLLETGNVDRLATYVSGSGSDTLTFSYTVQAGDLSADLDYQSTAALALNGATIRNASNDDAVLTLPTQGGADSIAGQHDVVIDGVAPTVASVSLPADGTYVAGQNLDFTVNFSEAVTVDTSGGTPRLAVALDTGGTVYADYLSGSGSSALVFRLTVSSGQLDGTGVTLGGSIDPNGGVLRDAVGNPASTTLNGVAPTAAVLVDAVNPLVASVTVPATAAYNTGDILTFTVNASEPVLVNTAGGTPRLLLDIGGVTRHATYISGSGSEALVFQYSVQAGDTDADGITVSGLETNGSTLRDAAGNTADLTLNGMGSTAGVTIDTTAPMANGLVRVDATPTTEDSVRFTLTFSEGVNGVDLGDFSLATTGTASGVIQSLVQVDAQTYQLTVGNLSGDGSLGVNLNAAGTDIVDLVGNALTAGLTGEAYTLDNSSPVVVAVSAAADGTYVAGQNLDFTVNFSEAVTVDTSGGTPRLAVALDTGGTVYADYLSGSGSSALVFRLTVSSGQLDSTGVTLGGSIDPNGGVLRDAVGNPASTTLNGVAPTGAVLLDAAAPQIVGLVADQASPSVDTTLSYTLTFSEPVQGLDTSDFALVTSGDASGTVQSIVQLSPTSYRVVIGQISGSGTLALTLDAASGITDLHGNALTDALPTVAYTIGDLNGGDPEWLTSSTPLLITLLPVKQPSAPPLTDGTGGSPTATPLFEPRSSGGGLPTLSQVFASTQGSTFVAQVFGDVSGTGRGAYGFLGFGGGDANVYDRSELARTFGQRGDGETPQLGAVFGARSLNDQLRDIDTRQTRAIDALTTALGQLVAEGPSASANHKEPIVSEPHKGAAQG